MKKVTITSAVALSAAQRKTLADAIEKKHGKVELVEEINPAVLGGVKVTIDSEQIDATVAAKLKQVQNQLS